MSWLPELSVSLARSTRLPSLTLVILTWTLSLPAPEPDRPRTKTASEIGGHPRLALLLWVRHIRIFWLRYWLAGLTLEGRVPS